MRDPLTNELVSLGTNSTKADANRRLTLAAADESRGAWVDPRRSQLLLEEYADNWMVSRPEPLAPRTVELYRGLLRNHIVPTFGRVELGQITTAAVRRWHAELVADAPAATRAAKAYRLLRAILATAVEDELIVKNPCTIRGAGVEHSPERPVATIPQVYALANAVEPGYRVLVLAAAFSSLREGELFGLRRRRIDLLHSSIRVVEQLQSLSNGRVLVGPPKSKAGTRTVRIPALLVPELKAHLAEYVAPDGDALVFCGPKGAPMRREHWARKWGEARRVVGLDGLHFRDLRHTGNTLAASTGASTKELMARMGHASPRAALIYQHATEERDAAIASAINELIARAAADPVAPVVDLRPATGS
jgi:integrase